MPPLRRGLREEELLFEKSVADMTPAELKVHRKAEADADQWHLDHPVDHKNIVKRFKSATPEEIRQGMNWYKDAHHTMKALAKDTKVSNHQMAGLISNYSPQTYWHTNIITAARVAREKKAAGGPGGGVMASTVQKTAAQRMLDGEHYNDVLDGHKTRAFAHLIEHGGDQHQNNPQHPDYKPRVVIDRHAHSAASGARLSDMAFGRAGLKSKKKYGAVEQAYVDAAAHLSKKHGMQIHPHQVQAVTWLAQQRLNSVVNKKVKSTGVSAVAVKAKEMWNKYAGTHHPKLVGKEPGTGYGG